MILQEFINKYNGKQVEAGGSSGALYQCVDLINQYLSDFGYNKILGTDAKNFVSPLKAQGFTQVSNPEAGDIAIWSWSHYGHIAIYIGNGQYLTQNHPIKLRTTISKLSNNSLIAFMRPKGELTMAQIDDLINRINVFEEHCGQRFTTIEGQINRVERNIATRFTALDNKKCECGSLNAEQKSLLDKVKDIFGKLGL